MKLTIRNYRSLLACVLMLILISCQTGNNEPDTTATEQPAIEVSQNYSTVNGLKMYYEIHKSTGNITGTPLVLIHGAGSTIGTSFGRILPQLAENRQIIAVELQGHGRTEGRNTELSFEQDADDVAALLKNLNVDKADFFGFSNGGNTALQITIRHPQLCNKVIAGSILLKRDGTFPQFWEFMKNGTFDQMPQQYKDAFLEVTPDTSKLVNMYQKCANRMINFKDFPDKQISSIKAPVLLINGGSDVATSDHVLAMSKLIPNCQLAIIPGGHGAYIGEITSLDSAYEENEFIVPMIEKFLDVKPKE